MPATRQPPSLKARALQWLAQREHSRQELRRKLLHAARLRDAAAGAEAQSASGDRADADPAAGGAADPAAEVDALLDRLATERHLSEGRFIESRVHARSARFGNRRIVQELAQHGAVLDDATAAALKASEFGRARAVWQRKFGDAPAADRAARAKQMRFLAGRGFAADVIRRVVEGGEED